VQSSKRSVVVVVAMVVVVTLLIWAGVHNARSRKVAMQQAEDARASQAVLIPDASSRAGGDRGSAEGGGMTPKLQGKVAPSFSLVDLTGKKVSLADFKGKPVLINFWATWCGPCKIEMPWFEEFNKKYAGQGLVILGVAADDASKTLIANTAQKLGVTYPVLLKDDKVEDAYGGVSYLPESFYVDKTGKVMLETAGLNDDAGGKDEIEANIKKLIAAGGQ
jgi:thiol-disulfide isomerase/thioredoxin